MTRGIWRDPERYIETYWSTYEGVWRHGDWAKIEDDGSWYLLGRSDDTINVAGKRLGPGEVESVLISHPAVVESAEVGVPDETKGEAVWCFVVAPGAGGALAAELGELVASELGAPVQALAGRRGGRPAEDPLGQDHPPRRARGGGGGGPGRPLQRREPGRPRRDQGGAGAPIAMPEITGPTSKRHSTCRGGLDELSLAGYDLRFRAPPTPGESRSE